MIVQNQLTPLTRDEATSALLTAYQQLTGAPPTAAVLALLLAQSAFETGHWRSIHNFNFGNAKAGPDYPLITQFRCSEVDEHGVEHFYDPPNPQCNFRAYADAAAGALDHLKVLHSRPHWWQALHTGDPSAFVDGLATPPKYFTGNIDLYKRSVVSLFHDFYPLAKAALAVPPPRPAPLPPASALPVPAARAWSSPSVSPPSQSSGVRSAPPNGSSNAVGKPATVPPQPTAPAAQGSPETVPLSCSPQERATFWQGLVRVLRSFLAFVFRLPPSPPGQLP